MTDKQKVIKGLEICKNPHGRCAECPYDDGKIDFTNCTSILCGDALALLKEQDVSRETSSIEIEGGGSTWWHVCEECRGAVDVNDKYCRHCGRRFNEMTIKEMAKKLNVEYQVVYQALAYSGLLKRHHKNTDYDEEQMINACEEYLCSRVIKFSDKLDEVNSVLARIADSAKKECHK